MYDQHNIFAKILRGDIPCQKIAKNEWFLSFHDIAPNAAIHALVIPTGPYENLHDFIGNALPDEITHFWKGVETTIELLSLKENGYRIIANTGTDGQQEVPHFHVHILGGQNLGAKLVK